MDSIDEYIRRIIQEEVDVRVNIAVSKAIEDILKAAENPKYLTINETCKLLRVTRPTLHAIFNNRQLHRVKVNGRTLIAMSEVRELLNER